ncbi:hypothetical protein EJB05_10292 [Eragrostis curvula]|uniref:Uncharacterized protein n=1 Tax=Eragrostis curvula TaxID=38414 RepID=A0A5J9W764_9POAL|nr:hypothetical protein EJB05_10292 [Eragrostis curvula]
MAAQPQPTAPADTEHYGSDDFLPKVPSVVFIDRKTILTTAMAKLNRPPPHECIDDLGHSSYICTLTIDLPPHRLFPDGCSKPFMSFSTVNAADAIQLACESALTYLETHGLIIVDDFNRPARRQELFLTNITDLLEKKVCALQLLTDKYRVLYEDLHAQIHDVLAIAPADFSVQSRLDSSQTNTEYIGPVPPETQMQRLFCLDPVTILA